MKHHGYLHILCFLRFSHNTKKPDATDKNYDRLWKLRTLSDILNGLFVKFYDLCEHLTEDKVTEKFKVQEIFRQYTHKYKCFGMTVHKFNGDRLYI
jgi:hypothetical protein